MPGLNEDLQGKVAIVTGATSGIGEATALALGGAGAKVVVAGRREDRLQELAGKLEGALAVTTDVTDESQARGLVERANEEMGSVDILVNNAGVMLLGPIEGADTEDWRRMVSVNLLGLFYCTHAALPLMRAQGSGDIVNVSSVAGRRATSFSGVYNATKFGVVGFSEALRQETVGAGIRVVVIEPGAVKTELISQITNPAVRDAAEKFIADMDEPLESEDIARAILYAVSQPPRVSVNEMLIRPTEQRG
jgi:NADP-dependent 3-hydroxy acid dehydrogenase YdfG